MKSIKLLSSLLALSLVLASCGGAETESTTDAATSSEPSISEPIHEADVTSIELSDDSIKVNGAAVSADTSSDVYTANDIVYYEAGKDFTYGEGTADEAHTAEEAAAHTVVHITKAGAYQLSGKLTKGQIAVDLGKEAKDDPTAVVTLILDGLDITCEVAPAVIFYNVYECGSDDADTATKDVDTSAAGANVIIADGSTNYVNGSHVARIYKPESVVLSEDGTKVVDEKKLHKYDGAFYSKMSMNIDGGELGDGKLTIKADNEGLDTELHLTINGGIIEITSGNDGINTNEDGVSVTTVNGGTLKITVSGETGEGDGIDSNGWLVINGGNIYAYACSTSADSGIDSDMGIHINGGTVVATGSMLDRIEDGGQNYAVFSFANRQSGSEAVNLVNEAGGVDFTIIPPNGYSNLIISYPDLKAGTYTMYLKDKQLVGASGGNMGGFGGGMLPGGMGRPEGGNFTMPEGGFTMPEGFNPSEGFTPPNGENSEWSVPPTEITPPDGGNFDFSAPPTEITPSEGNFPGGGQRPNGGFEAELGELSEYFVIVDGGNMFSGVKVKE